MFLCFQGKEMLKILVNISKFQKLLAFLKDMPYNIFRRLAIRRYTI